MSRRKNPDTEAQSAKLSPEDAFGRVIRQRRMQLGLTQADLEDPEGEGLERSHISRLEAGKAEVGLRGILHLAERLQMGADELMAAVVKAMRTGK